MAPANTIGEANCAVCVKNPSHALAPCGHTVCYDHFLKAEPECMTCGICSTFPVTSSEVSTSSPSTISDIHPADRTWKSDPSNEATAELSLIMAPKDSRRTVSDEGYDAFRAFNETPTPVPDNEDNANDFITDRGAPRAARYVPPQLRNGVPADVVRPESSASNATFATQVPMQHVQATQSVRPTWAASQQSWKASYLASLPLPAPLVDRGPYPNAAPGYTPSFKYAYGPAPDNGYYPITDAYGNVLPELKPPMPRPQLPAQSRPQPMQQPMHQSQPQLSWLPGSQNTMYTPQGNTNNGANLNFVNGGGVRYTQANASPADSAVATRTGANMSHPAHLAKMIRDGLTDDPLDPNYGNPGYGYPGPSRRSTQASDQPMSEMPLKRGKVAASNSTAIANYHSEPNTKGNAAAFLGMNEVDLPSWFHELKRKYQPTVEEVFESLPMIEPCRAARATTAGVVKIGNIPYKSTRSEIVAFLGRHADILRQPEGSPYHAIHINIERGQGKTLDAYVEVASPKEAAYICGSFDKRQQLGRNAKVDNRTVTTEVITYGDFMADLFPHARNVEWEGPNPKITTEHDFYYPGVQSAGFTGFLKEEELNMLVKWAEMPSRSPFLERGLYRLYEHLTTILHKYPWFAVQHVLVKERDKIFDTTFKCIRALMSMLRSTKKDIPDKPRPAPSVLQELVVAALTCPGFSEGQKSAIILNLVGGSYSSMTTGRGMNLRLGGKHKFACEWPFRALVPQPGADDKLIEYIASIFRSATTNAQTMTLADLHSMNASGTHLPTFGNVNINYDGVITLADMGRVELRAVEEMLSRILPRFRRSPLGSLVASGSGSGSFGSRHASQHS